MNHDDLEEILASEPSISPSPAFESSVMRAVRLEFEEPRPLAFPWRRAAVGGGLCLGLTVAACILAAWNGANPPPELARLEAFARNPLVALTTVTLVSTLLGSLVLVWFSFRLAEPHS
jgi:hypothetical protein